MRPSRLGLVAALVPSFVRAFYSTNPLSQLGLSVARHGVVERIAELSGSPEAHCAALARTLARQGGCSGGQLSLQNVLDQAVASLLHVPPYGSREVLLLQSSLSSCDPVRCRAQEAGRKLPSRRRPRCAPDECPPCCVGQYP